MKLGRYLFTNTVTIWGYSRRVLVILWIVMVIALLGTYLVVQSGTTIEDSVIQLLRGSSTQQIIQEIPTLLQEGEYITITREGGLDSNKAGPLIANTKGEVFVVIDSNKSCEDWFGQTNKGVVLLSKKSLCINNNNKQQVITYAQLLDSQQMSQLTSSTIFQRSAALRLMISSGSIMITNTSLEMVRQELQTITTSPVTATELSQALRKIINIMIVPSMLLSFLIAMMITIISLLGLLMFSLITQGISSLMNYKISYLQAFRISWLPWILLTSLGILLSFIAKLLIWIIVIAGLIHWYLGYLRRSHPNIQSDLGVDKEEITDSE